MLMFMFLSIILSVATVVFTHPISMMVTILTQTTIVCLIIWILTKSSWFSFILFLIFLGGLMVLFVYISSLASNEMFILSSKEMMKILLITLTLTSLMLLNSLSSKNLSISKDLLLEKILVMFNNNLIFTSITVMLYLLLVLIVAIKVASKMEGPMRNLI